ncbi:hypothetical protein P171DRAFT_520721 [Karstenula rhodostoma CBS 690.94]|uniref:Rhodopsin domain-containing protein n=1 Tax=Karstenula rhodostoma CBS 690.94 TaxID=1392251 RepID=A0A9P4UDC6_9PLEO|nr:hypothetical protein P171DRAFT_520721 [Karstenula rhodostoma CBS 690.94]
MGYVADQTSLLVTNVTLIVAAELSVALRFWVRRRMRTPLAADDWCALAAGIVFFVQDVVMCWAISRNYVGLDPRKMDMEHLETSLKLVFIGIFLMSIILTLCRFSVLFLYNRLFGVYTTFRKILVVCGVASLMWPVTIWFGTTFRCSPVKGSWKLHIGAKCVFDIEHLFIGTEPINAVLDVLLVILPINKIKILQLPLRERIGLAVVFLLGGFVGFTSILRIIFTYNPSKLGAIVDSVFWLQLQLGTAIVCCCLPTLRSLLPSKQLFVPLGASIQGLLGSRKTNLDSRNNPSGSKTLGSRSVNVDRQRRINPPYFDTTGSTKSDDEIALTDVDSHN